MTDQRSLLVRAAWFVLVGWWATLLAINFAWLCNATIVGLPLGIKIINRVPKLLTLREPQRRVDPASGGQPSLIVRAVYFVLVGWWASLLWANLAWALCVTVVGLPIGIKMFEYLPLVTSLYDCDA